MGVVHVHVCDGDVVCIYIERRYGCILYELSLFLQELLAIHWEGIWKVSNLCMGVLYCVRRVSALETGIHVCIIIYVWNPWDTCEVNLSYNVLLHTHVLHVHGYRHYTAHWKSLTLCLVACTCTYMCIQMYSMLICNDIHSHDGRDCRVSGETARDDGQKAREDKAT